MAQQNAQRTRNEKVGTVVSDKMAKTVVVEVTRRVQHPLYRRVITKRKKFYAHDEDNSARIGDTVRIVEARPTSRLKRWRLGEILRRAVQVAEIETQADTAVRTTKKKKKKEEPAPGEAA